MFCMQWQYFGQTTSCGPQGLNVYVIFFSLPPWSSPQLSYYAHNFPPPSLFVFRFPPSRPISQNFITVPVSPTALPNPPFHYLPLLFSLYLRYLFSYPSAHSDSSLNSFVTYFFPPLSSFFIPSSSPPLPPHSVTMNLHFHTRQWINNNNRIEQITTHNSTSSGKFNCPVSKTITTLLFLPMPQ